MQLAQDPNLLSTTDVAIGGDEAENDGTAYDNFYGAGSTGMGTTRHEVWGMIGPGVKNQGMAKIDNTLYNSDAVAATLLYGLGLPAPFEARDPAISAWFTASGPRPHRRPFRPHSRPRQQSRRAAPR